MNIFINTRSGSKMLISMCLALIFLGASTTINAKQNDQIVIDNMQEACDSLQDLELIPPPGVDLVEIENTELRDSGLDTEHCAVTFIIDSEISSSNIDDFGTSVYQRSRFFLPKVYNQRFRFFGGGGFSAGLSNNANVITMQRGTAQGTTGIVVENPTYNDNYSLFANQNHDNEGYRILERDGVYLSTVVGKQVLKTFYGKLPLYSYYHGNSRGGAQGIQVAFAHPDTFDGITVSEPAMVPYTLDPLRERQKMELFAPELLSLGTQIANEVLLSCDGLDGIIDEIIDFPSECKPNLEAIYDKFELSPIAREILNDYLTGRTIIGDSNDPDLGIIAVTQTGFPITINPFGNLDSLRGVLAPYWLSVDARLNSYPIYIGNTGAFSVLFTGSANFLPFDFDTNSMGYFDLVAEAVAIPYNTIGNGNLKAFSKAGGKMILLHGWRDPLTSIKHTISWYEQQVNYFAGAMKYGEDAPQELKTGAEALLRNTLRFFTTSSGLHDPSPLVSDEVRWNAIEDWVEKENAPKLLMSSATGLINRPACEYPEVPVRIDETINFDVSDNWECVTVKKATKSVTPLNRADYAVDAAPASTCSNQPNVTNPDTGKEYKLCGIGTAQFINPSVAVFDSPISWADSVDVCANLGGYLVKIEDQDENDFLTQTFVIANNLPRYNSPWIGANDIDVEGNWIWVSDSSQFWQGNQTGMPVNGAYNNWISGQPNNLGSGEDCASFRGEVDAGGWQDGPCSGTHPYICEFD